MQEHTCRGQGIICGVVFFFPFQCVRPDYQTRVLRLVCGCLFYQLESHFRAILLILKYF